MFSWAIFFALMGIVAGIFGFGGFAGAATSLAKMLCVVGLLLFFLSLVKAMGDSMRQDTREGEN